MKRVAILPAILAWLGGPCFAAPAIQHDAEYYVVEAQNGQAWHQEDKELGRRLEALEKKFGRAPNIVHVMWDDMSVGEVGIPVINKMRGYETPNVNKMAQEGILFTRMYTENSCTPSRAASITGRYAVRSGMTQVGFPIEAKGLPAREVTIAEVLSKAGYMTGFYGKWHLGDIEESYPHNQGFDEAFFTPYNQVLSLYNPMGEAANVAQGIFPPQLKDDPYQLDKSQNAFGWVMTMEANKGEQAKEWGDIMPETYDAIDPEAQKRSLEFMRKAVAKNKPFYIASWPNMASFLPKPKKKQTLNRTVTAESFSANVDPYLGRIMDQLRALGIAENTLVIAMADNGPMVHNAPNGLGMNETLYRGGKDDATEGGIRVPAFAWWPDTIKSRSIVGDMIHQTDLYTTFARLAGALDHVPSDRIIDGIDQTALLLNGDTHGRRDYNHVYQSTRLAATIKGDIKRYWSASEGSIVPPMYNVLQDTREAHPMLVPLLHRSSHFDLMKERHLGMKEKYPDQPIARGVPYEGVSNLKPLTKKVQQLYRDKE